MTISFTPPATGSSPGSGGALLGDVFPGVADQTEMLALPAQQGDSAFRTDISDPDNEFILKGTDPTNIAHWQQQVGGTITTLQQAHDAAPNAGIRGLTTLGSPTVDTDVSFAGVVQTLITEGAHDARQTIVANGQLFETLQESLIDRTTVAAAVATDNIIDVGVDTSLLDDSLGLQFAGQDQFPTVLLALTDAGVKLGAAVSVANGVASNSLITVVTPFGPDILTTDTTNGGTLEFILVKFIAEIGPDGIKGYTGNANRIRQVTATQTIRKDDYNLEVAANSVALTLPTGDPGDEFVVHVTGTFTGCTVAPDGGSTINGSSSPISINGNFRAVTFRRETSGSWVAEGSGVGNARQAMTAVQTSGTYQIIPSDENVIADTTSATVRLDLPAGPGNGDTFTLTLLAFVSTLTIGRNGSGDIDGVAADNTTLLAADRASVTLQFNTGTGWVVIASS